MNLDQLQQKLIAVAKANPPSDKVPLAFEKRIMARIAAELVPNLETLWVRALWRGAALCLAVVLLFGVWAFFTLSGKGHEPDFSQDFENTVLAAVEQQSDFSW